MNLVANDIFEKHKYEFAFFLSSIMRSYRQLNVHKIMYVNSMFLVWSQILKICKSMLAWCISFTEGHA